MNGAEALIPLTLFAGGFATLFGIYYLKTRQNLAMIEKGMNPKEVINRPAPYKNLKWAMLLMGSGIGLFIAYMLDQYALPHTYYTETWGGNTLRHRNDDAAAAIYFALIAVGGGLGLFISYFLEKKWWDQNYSNDKHIIG